MTRRRGLTNEEIKKILEESDDEDIDLDDEIDDPDFQDPTHNLQYSSDSDECEMDIDHDTIPQNTKNSDALSDTDTASLSSVDEIPSANASGCKPILWFHADSTFQPRMTIPAESSPSLLFKLNRSATKLDVFLKIFPKSLMIWISQCTNQRLEKLGQTIHPTDPSEIMLVLGCMLVMSYNRVPKFSHYWSSNPSLGNVAIKNAISRDRCKTLLSKLYFAAPEKPENASKTYYIDEVVSCLKQTFKQCRSESSYQAIDESMAKFKGRSSLKQYMPMKPVKRGIKIWQRCDSKTGYVYDMNIYSGKETGEVQGTLGERVVSKLTETIRGKDVMLAFDRFFTSVHLMETLKFPAVGTCIKTRKDVPNFATKLSKRGEAEFLVTKNGTLCARWLDSKEVMMLSNCHEAKYTKVNRTMKDGSKEEFECPVAIEFYNKIMGGVDLADQMANVYELD
ncbi:piggyBac transposable element-derived protein 3-like [Stegodyphus dumicola]|uniref:piggyBac transposable element-derived protein 3-like n=1 Tax=Stegodyphus dumicola TaxID=202533 RepID=UPI0015AE4063|nr:piggyBac transposable element-derived protein 3-like [Stegodyphus dumicola]